MQPDLLERWRRIDRAMAIFAHCDDVEMRMGGSFARLVREGHRVSYVVSVENAYVGQHVEPRPPVREALAIRRAESTRAAGLLGAARVEFLAFKSFYLSREDGTVVYPSLSGAEAAAEELKGVPPYGLPPVLNAYTIPECHDRLAALIREERPQAVFTQSPDDRHQDHYCVARVVSLIVDDLNREGADIDVWYSEPGTGGAMAEFWPNAFVELSVADVCRRQDACACYPSQFPDDRRLYTAEHCRAYGRAAGVPYAEAFRVGTWPRMLEADGETIARIAAGPPKPLVVRL